MANLNGRMEALKSVMYPTVKKQSYFESVSGVIDDWSPNNLRRIFILKDKVFLEYYIISKITTGKNVFINLNGNCIRSYVLPTLDQSSIMQLQNGANKVNTILGLIAGEYGGKKFQNLEEIVFIGSDRTPEFGLDTMNFNMLRNKFKAFKRLKGIAYLACDEQEFLQEYNNINRDKNNREFLFTSNANIRNRVTYILNNSDNMLELYKNIGTRIPGSDTNNVAGFYSMDIKIREILEQRLETITNILQERENKKREFSVRGVLRVLNNTKFEIIAKDLVAAIKYTKDIEKQDFTFSSSYFTAVASAVLKKVGEFPEGLKRGNNDMIKIRVPYDKDVDDENKIERVNNFLEVLGSILDFVNISMDNVTDKNFEEYTTVVFKVARGALFAVVSTRYQLSGVENIVNIEPYEYSIIDTALRQNQIQLLYNNGKIKAIEKKMGVLLEAVKKWKQDNGSSNYTSSLSRGYRFEGGFKGVKDTLKYIYDSNVCSYNVKTIDELLHKNLADDKSHVYAQIIKNIVKAIKYIYNGTRDMSISGLRSDVAMSLSVAARRAVLENYEFDGKYVYEYDEFNGNHVNVDINDTAKQSILLPIDFESCNKDVEDSIRKYAIGLSIISNYTYIDVSNIRSCENLEDFIRYILLTAKSMLFAQVAFYHNLNTSKFSRLSGLSKCALDAVYFAMNKNIYTKDVGSVDRIECNDAGVWVSNYAQFEKDMESVTDDSRVWDYVVRAENGVDIYSIYRFTKEMMDKVRSEEGKLISVSGLDEILYSTLPDKYGTDKTYIMELNEAIRSMEFIRKTVEKKIVVYIVDMLRRKLNADIGVQSDIKLFNSAFVYEIEKLECFSKSNNFEIIKTFYSTICKAFKISFEDMFNNKFKDNLAVILGIINKLVFIYSIYKAADQSGIVIGMSKESLQYLRDFERNLSGVACDNYKEYIREFFVNEKIITASVKSFWTYSVIGNSYLEPDVYKLRTEVGAYDVAYNLCINPVNVLSGDMINHVLRYELLDCDTGETYGNYINYYSNFVDDMNELIAESDILNLDICAVIAKLAIEATDNFYSEYSIDAESIPKLTGEHRGVNVINVQNDNAVYVIDILCSIAAYFGIKVDNMNDKTLFVYMTYLLLIARKYKILLAAIEFNSYACLEGVPEDDAELVKLVVAKTKNMNISAELKERLENVMNSYKEAHRVTLIWNYKLSKAAYERAQITVHENANVEEAYSILKLNIKVNGKFTKEGLAKVMNKKLRVDGNRTYGEEMIHAVMSLGVVQEIIADNNLYSSEIIDDIIRNKIQKVVELEFSDILDRKFKSVFNDVGKDDIKVVPDDVNIGDKGTWDDNVRFFAEQFIPVIKFLKYDFNKNTVTDTNLEQHLLCICSAMQKLLFILYLIKKPCIYKIITKIPEYTYDLVGDLIYYNQTRLGDREFSVDLVKAQKALSDRARGVFNISYKVDKDRYKKNISMYEFYADTKDLQDDKQVVNEYDELKKYYSNYINTSILEEAMLNQMEERKFSELTADELQVYIKLYKLAAKVILVYRFVYDDYAIFTKVKRGIIEKNGPLWLYLQVTRIVNNYLRIYGDFNADMSISDYLDITYINEPDDDVCKYTNKPELDNMLEKIDAQVMCLLPEDFSEKMLNE